MAVVPKDQLPLTLAAPGLWVQAPFARRAAQAPSDKAPHDPHSWGITVAIGGRASFLDQVTERYGPPHALLARFSPALHDERQQTLMGRRAAPDDPGQWSVDGGRTWRPVTAPVVAVYGHSAYDPREAMAEWGIPRGWTGQQAAHRWGRLLDAPPPSCDDDPWDPDDVPPRLFARTPAQWSPHVPRPNGIARLAPMQSLLDRPDAGTDGPVIHIRMERTSGAVAALIAVRAGGREEPWDVID